MAQPIYVAPHSAAAIKSAGGEHLSHDEVTKFHRAMHAQAGGTWHNLRIRFNWTYVDAPQLDVRQGTTDGYRACYPGGPDGVIVGEPTFFNTTTQKQDAPLCFDNGVHSFIDNCKMICNDNSTASTADRQMLKDVSSQVAAKFASVLQSETLPGAPDSITIASNAPQANQRCGGLFFEQYDVQNIDIVIYATIRPLLQTGGTIAFASSCAVHPTTDRPILAHMNVAPETLKTNNDMYTVLLHELTHALGFTPDMYGRYRHPQDNSRTYYEYDSTAYPLGPLSGTGAAYDPEALPQPRVVVNYLQLSNNPGTKLKFITPRVLEHGRQYYNCSTLDGVELENGGNSSSSTASHWEMRILKGEYMVARQSNDMVMSGFTLALFDDMGFYKANLALGETMYWGNAMGCSWATNKCDQWPSNYFCGPSPPRACNYNFTGEAYCKYTPGSAATVTIPSPYRYFPNAEFPTKAGGTDALADYCPYYETYANTHCSLVPAAGSQDALIDDQLGRNTGPMGRCFFSDVIQTQYDKIATSPGCFSMLCNSSSPASTPWATVRIGNGLYPCPPSGGVVNLMYLPRSSKANLIAENPVAYNAFNPDYAGTFICGIDITRRCLDPVKYQLSTTDQVSMPRAVEILPARGFVEGGSDFNITGVNLANCPAVRIGGVWATDITHEGTNVIKGKTAEVGAASVYGGSGTDGIGVVDVEVFCNVSSVCPEGCSATQLPQSFELVYDESATVNLASALEEFLNTTVGKIVGAIVALIVVVVIICILKSCLAEGDNGEVALKEPVLQRQYDDVVEMRRRDFGDDDDIL